MGYNDTAPGAFGYQQDPFSSPFNPINANPGAWSVDPFYLTPAYAAPYRPGYTGPNGYNPYDYEDPGYLTSLNRVTSGFGYDPKFSNPYSFNQTAYDTLHSNPIDASASIAQQFAIPMAASYAAHKFGSSLKVARNNPFAGKVVGGAFRLGGSSAAEAAQAAAYSGVFTRMGNSASQAAVGGAMRMINRQAPQWMLQGAGAIGGAAGSLFLPLAAGQAISSIADTALFDPYIAQRQVANELKRNLSHSIMDPSISEHNTGRGLSYEGAAKIASGIISDGVKDRTLELGDISMISEYSAQSGLLASTSNEQQIKDRIKEVTSQVKLIMNIANEPSVREAIEMVAKLRSAGVGQQYIPGVMQELTQKASVAGVSVQRLMSTVGAQGQMMAQQAGVTPYVGQLMAARSFATFRAAERMGVLSPEVLASMGGTEGATQSSMAGSFRAMESTYGKAYLFNKYMQKDGTTDLVDTLGTFAQGYVKDPLNALGLLELNQGMMAGQELKKNPNVLVESLENSFIKAQPRQLYYNDKGELKAGSLYSAMKTKLNMSHEEAQAAIQQLIANQDPAVQKNKTQGTLAALEEARVGELNQVGLGNGYIGNTLSYNWRSAKMGVQEWGTKEVSNINETWARTSDSIKGYWEKSMYGEGYNAKYIEKNATASPKLKLLGEKSSIIYDSLLGSPIKTLREVTSRREDQRILDSMNAMGKDDKSGAFTSAMHGLVRDSKSLKEQGSSLTLAQRKTLQDRINSQRNQLSMTLSQSGKSNDEIKEIFEVLAKTEIDDPAQALKKRQEAQAKADRKTLSEVTKLVKSDPSGQLEQSLNGFIRDSKLLSHPNNGLTEAQRKSMQERVGLQKEQLTAVLKGSGKTNAEVKNVFDVLTKSAEERIEASPEMKYYNDLQTQVEKASPFERGSLMRYEGRKRGVKDDYKNMSQLAKQLGKAAGMGATFNSGMAAADLTSFQAQLEAKYDGVNGGVEGNITAAERKSRDNRMARYKAYRGLDKDTVDSEVLSSARQNFQILTNSKVGTLYTQMSKAFDGNNVEELMKDPKKFMAYAKHLKMDGKTISSFNDAVKNKDYAKAQKALTSWTADRYYKETGADIMSDNPNSAGGFLLGQDAESELGKQSMKQIMAVDKARKDLRKEFSARRIDSEGLFRSESALDMKESAITFKDSVDKFKQVVDGMGGRGNVKNVNTTQTTPTGQVVNKPELSSMLSFQNVLDKFWGPSRN